jgi:hypothetical protein
MPWLITTKVSQRFVVRYIAYPSIKDMCLFYKGRSPQISKCGVWTVTLLGSCCMTSRWGIAAFKGWLGWVAVEQWSWKRAVAFWRSSGVGRDKTPAVICRFAGAIRLAGSRVDTKLFAISASVSVGRVTGNDIKWVGRWWGSYSSKRQLQLLCTFCFPPPFFGLLCGEWLMLNGQMGADSSKAALY